MPLGLVNNWARFGSRLFAGARLFADAIMFAGARLLAGARMLFINIPQTTLALKGPLCSFKDR